MKVTPQLKQMRVTLTGIRPMICHNGALADPLNDIVKQMKKLTSKKTKKTESDIEELARLEWIGGWYLKDGMPVIPSDNIESFVIAGARKARRGKDVLCAVFCVESEVPIEHKELKAPLESLYGLSQFTLRKAVRVTTNRVMRVRPMVPTGWKLRFTLEFDPSIINPGDIQTALADAAALVGFGEWRPKFGRCTVTTEDV